MKKRRKTARIPDSAFHPLAVPFTAKQLPAKKRFNIIVGHRSRTGRNTPFMKKLADLHTKMEKICQSNAVGILLWRRVERIWIYGRGKRCFSSPQLPEYLWDPSSFLFSAQFWFFPRRKSGREMLFSQGKFVPYLVL
jgi:hypothetical protein